MSEMEYNPSEVTIDITSTTEDVTEVELPEQPPTLQRNMFYAQDGLFGEDRGLSKEDKMRYNDIKRRVKRLRKLERSPLFEVKKMMIREESNDA